MLRCLLIALALVGLSGCAGYTERTSPCVCTWTPLGAAATVPA